MCPGVSEGTIESATAKGNKRNKDQFHQVKSTFVLENPSDTGL